jgi:hypothetical protein
MIRVVLVAGSFLLGACGAMSESAYERLATEVSQRNEQRYENAFSELRRQGYVFVDDELIRFASLDEGARQRCRDAANGNSAPVPSDKLKIDVTQPSRPNAPAPSVVEVFAPASQACEFFRDGSNALGVTDADGSTRRLLRSPGPRALVRSPSGEVLHVVVNPRVIEKRTVTVKRTCNEMPSTEPEPFERPRTIPVMWRPLPKLRTIEVRYDREDLDMECTDHVY